ncbi:hypothetical protein Tco_0551463 [Tanacetum coccineum]
MKIPIIRKEITIFETSALPAPKTAKQLAAKRNQERVKSILLLAIPDEYSSRFTMLPVLNQLRSNQIEGFVVYEDELKRSSGSNSASQNLAFLSFENTGSTNEISTASGDFGISTAGGINQVLSISSAHDVAYSFLAQPTTSPQHENEDY